MKLFNALAFAIASIMIVVLLASCKKNEPQPTNTTNKLVLLQVDYMTNVFEGGKELEFDSLPYSSNFTISFDYDPPGDFGDIQLFYTEADEIIFDGTMIWMGIGKVNYPIMDTSSFFVTEAYPLNLPGEETFEWVAYTQPSSEIPYESIWNDISQLSIVAEYRSSNPNSKIHLFLYIPASGPGCPSLNNWYVILKN